MVATIVYDERCALCRRMVAWVARRDADGRFRALGCRAPERALRFPWLSESDCLAAVQLIEGDGGTSSAEVAVGRILRALPGWGWLGRVVLLRPLRPLTGGGYRWVARHRRRLGCAGTSMP